MTGRDRRAVAIAPSTIWLGVYDSLSARLAELSGASALWVSSYCLSATVKSLPDAAHLTATEVLQASRAISLAASRTPVVVDCDTGFGDAGVFEHVVREFCLTTRVAGLCIEDKQSPKRNSFYDNSFQQLEAPETFAEKIAAGVRARDSLGELLIVARTEALVLGLSMEEALERLTLYADAGADAVLVQAKADVAPLLAIAKEWRLSGIGIPMICVPTAFVDLSPQEFWGAGFEVVVQANQLLRAAVQVQLGLCVELGDPAVSLSELSSRMVTMSQLNEIVGAAGFTIQDVEEAEL